MQRGDEARLALIDAAMREASRIGLAALTLAPVAERAGWSKGGLLRHFPNKESLQLALAPAIFFLVQVPLSVLWLRHFEYGPLEYAWRVLTYGRMRSKPVTAAAS